MMRVTKVLGVTLLLSTAIWGIKNQPTEAVVTADGTVYFALPPSLVKTRTAYRDPAVPSTYYFTLSLPSQAGEPLQRVTFTQYKGLENIEFDLKHTEAEAETLTNSEQRLTLVEVTRDRQTKTVSVTFNPPVLPGRTVTIGLHARSNPLHGGVYLFGVKAFPAGEKSYGQFLGYGRLQFLVPGSRL
jgi:hypothetical protein